MRGSGAPDDRRRAEFVLSCVMQRAVLAVLLLVVSGGCATSSLGGGVGKTVASRDVDGNLFQIGGDTMSRPRASGIAFGAYGRVSVVDGNGPGFGDGEFPRWIEAGGKARYYLGRGVIRAFVEAELGTGAYFTEDLRGAAIAARAGSGLEFGRGAIGARVGARAGGDLLVGSGGTVGLLEGGVFAELVYRASR